MKHAFAFLFLLLLFAGCTNRGVGFYMYTSSDQGTTWVRSRIEVASATTSDVVDPTALLLSNGEVLLYYLASNGDSDPAFSQPDNIWRIGMARSRDNGVSFTQESIIFQRTSGISDPEILEFSGDYKMYFLDGPNQQIVSLSSISNDPTNWATSLDSGARATIAGTPSLMQVGSNIHLYGCPSVNYISYYTSADALSFTLQGASLNPNSSSYIVCDASVKKTGSTYVMAYKIAETSSTSPQDNLVFWATSTDGITFTTGGIIGYGSVPALLIDQNGVWRVYVPDYSA